MPPPLLFDLSNIDLNGESLFTKEDILGVNPQDYEMRQLDGILWYNGDEHYILGYKDLTDDEFWIRGHIPGRPLMPAVIMIEAAAQLSSFYVKRIYGLKGFIGFMGIDKATFRYPVEPGSRVLMLAHITKFRSRKYTCDIQGLVKVGDDYKMAFSTTISGGMV
ncbi:MAG: beta-hydroxyacyl-ACP dehydratase [Planctomycetes bacterium]|nr:beta-hydroxyacyl-ACP dehydratase [Planctomycetota bacterium]